MTAMEKTKVWWWKMGDDISVIDQTVDVWMNGLEPAGEGIVSDSWLSKSVSKINVAKEIF